LAVPQSYFAEAMVRLRTKYLAVALSTVPPPASPYAQKAAEEQKAAAGKAPLVREDELKPIENVSLLPLLVWWLDPRISSPIATSPHYKAKLSFVFRNTGAQPVHVRTPRWSGVGHQPPFGFGYQKEKTKGEADWDVDAKYALPVDVEPGWSFKLWIGLDPAIAQAALENRRDRLRLGTLTIPTKVGDRESNLEYQV
jgi:hypothetical protein